MDLLPSSRLRNPVRVQRLENNLGSLNWVPIFCANCGADGGMVPEENMSFAFYLCNPWAEKWAPLTNTYMEPDAVFWQKVREAQLEKYGRELAPSELVDVLKDDSSVISKLCKDRGK
jgi:hypothetical protein